MRFRENFTRRAMAIGLIDPGIDFIVSLEVRWPWWRWFRFIALCRLYAGDQSGLPAGQVRNQIFDRPVTVDAGLIHACLTDLVEQSFPLLILVLQPIQKSSFLHTYSLGNRHAMIAAQR